MLKNVLVIIILLAQKTQFTEWNRLKESRHILLSRKGEKDAELKDMEQIVEGTTLAILEKGTTEKREMTIDLKEIKKVLNKLIEEIDILEMMKKRTCESTTAVPSTALTNLDDFSSDVENMETTEDIEQMTYRRVKSRRRENHRKIKRAKWGDWTEWSACSVTCGKGREIRWRHCQGNCDGIETEMEEKTCQLPACGTKLFGVLSL